MRTTVKVEGLRELGEAMRELGAKTAMSIAGSMTAAAAKLIKGAAISNIERNPSIDTGSLRDSVIVKKIPKSRIRLTSQHIVTVRGRGKVHKKTGVKQKEAPHAHMVEFGTVNMPAEPYMRPAFDQKKGDAVQVMKDTGARRIAAAARKAAKGRK